MPSTASRVRSRRLQLPELEDDEIACITWVGSTPLTADELLEKAEKKGSAVERAERFLFEYLSPGEAPSDEVKAAAKKAGMGQDSLWAAKSELGVIARRAGLGPWLWKLPYSATADHEASIRRADADHDASVQREPSWSDHDASRRFSSEEPSSYRNGDPRQIDRSVVKPRV